MMRRFCAALVCLLAPPAAQAQFELFRVDGNAEVAVPSIYDFGSVYAGETASVRFRLRNTAGVPATLFLLQVAGTGFALAAPPVPRTVAGPETVDFTVTFQGATIGSYSASLDLTGRSVLLLAAVAPSLTYSVALPSGTRQLGGAAVDFGIVPVGSSVSLRFTAENRTGRPLLVPSIGVQGEAFALVGSPPSGTVLQAQQQAGFEVSFAPHDDGMFPGVLTIGDRSYGLAGTAPRPKMPAPVLAIDLPVAQSARQGSVAVSLDGVVTSAGRGTVALDFVPAMPGNDDSTIAFASGGRTAAFTVVPGDTHGRFAELLAIPFQTGTTAGTLVVTATLGASTVRQSIPLPPLPVVLSQVEFSLTAEAVTVQVAGFDNTRSAGPLTFTFFDQAGSPIPPGALSSDASAQFASYFSQSSLGGVFLLRATFPVRGDPAALRTVEMQFRNVAGTTNSGRLNITPSSHENR